jgi:hypothetical protein
LALSKENLFHPSAPSPLISVVGRDVLKMQSFAVITLYCLLTSLFIYFSSNFGFWGWCLEPGGWIKQLMMFGLYGIHFLLMVKLFTVPVSILGIIVGSLSALTVVIHFQLYGWITFTSMHGSGSVLDPSYYILAGLALFFLLFVPSASLGVGDVSSPN